MKKSTFLILFACVMSIQISARDKKHVLVYTFTGEGYVHENVAYSAKAIEKLGMENGFTVDVRNHPGILHEDSIKKYDAIIFSNTNEQAFLNDGQRLAFKRYIQAGGAFVGIHGASTSEAHWPWYVSMVGGTFVRHPKFQKYTLTVIDESHPSTAFIKGDWEWEDECYFMDHLNPAMNVILAANLTTVDDEKKNEYPGTTFGHLFPAAWYQYYDGGKQWYTALGHDPKSYEDPVFLKHILEGILWAVSDTHIDYSKAKADKIYLKEKNKQTP